nr:hypothetical protein [Tanacetum cinerariifolium]
MFTSTNWRHPWDPYSIYQSIRMTNALQMGHPRDDIGATPSGIAGGIARASIGGEGDIRATPGVTSPSVTKEQIKGHLSALRSLLKEHNSQVNSGEWPMPVWCCMFQQTLDESAREITRIVRKANETLVAFKERCIVESGFIVGVPEVMKISSFVDAHKCPELANTKVPKDEVSKASKQLVGTVSRREDRFLRGGYRVDRRRNDGRNAFNIRDGLAPYRHQTYRGDHQGYHHLKLNLNLLTKHPKELLASELQLNLQPLRPMQLPPKKENQDKYCERKPRKGQNRIKTGQKREASRSASRCNVRVLLRKLKPRHEVVTKEHAYGLGRFRRGVVENPPGSLFNDTFLSIRMTGTLLGGGFGDDEETTPPTTTKHIEGCLSALKSLVKEHNSRGNVSPIRLNFDENGDRTRVRTIVIGKEVIDIDLKKPFKQR